MVMPRNPRGPKLTREKVRQIRRLRASGLSLSQLAERFGVSRQWVCKILRGDVWKERS
jgi:DNA invertase Pin-like site-specific DNA recombinase